MSDNAHNHNNMKTFGMENFIYKRHSDSYYCVIIGQLNVVVFIYLHRIKFTFTFTTYISPLKIYTIRFPKIFAKKVEIPTFL